MIETLIRYWDKNNVLSEEKINLLAKDLYKLLESAIKKYIKGQEEHRGNIEDRDLDLEIDQEIIDLFFYQQARKRKSK